MKTTLHLMQFDFRRCWKFFSVWWGYCLVFLGFGLSIIYSREYPEHENVGKYLFMLSGYFGLLPLLIALIIQPYRTGRLQSFFNVRTVSSKDPVKARLWLIAICLLLPFYIAQLVPLSLLRLDRIVISAFTLFFWLVYGAAGLALSFVAALSKGLTSSLVHTALSSFLVLNLWPLAFLLNHYWADSVVYYITYPEAIRLLWITSVCFCGGSLFFFLLRRVYARSFRWYLIVPGAVIAVACVGLLTIPKFKPDTDGWVYPVTTGQIDLDALNYQVSRDVNSGFEVRRNRVGGHSVSGQAKPPYVDTNGEEFWFFRGQLKVDGLDPKLNYTAKLLDAQWIAESGEVLDYAPSEGTESVTGAMYPPFPAPPTEARLDDLLPGVAGVPYQVPVVSGSDLLLFGAWTSDYERFKDMSGQLELTVRVDFYAHTVGLEIPLAGPFRETREEGTYVLGAMNQSPGELEIELIRLQAAGYAQVLAKNRWSGGNDWILYDSESFERKTSSGFVSEGYSFGSLGIRRLRLEFLAGHMGRNRNPPDSLRLVRIQPIYLGSTTFQITVNDIAPVNERALN